MLLRKFSATCSFWIGAALLFLVAALQPAFDDEWDNILGGRLIAESVPIYSGFFSHHMPAPYFVSALYHLFFPASALGVRVLFCALLIALFCSLERRVLSAKLIVAFRLSVVAMGLFASFAYSGALMAESLVAYAALSGVLIYSSDRLAAFTRAVLLSYCASLIILSSLGYVLLALVIALFSLVALAQDKNGLAAGVCLKFLLLSSLPYLALFAYLAFNNSLAEFFWQNLDFNTEHYFAFLQEQPPGFFSSLLASLLYCVQVIYEVFTVFGTESFRGFQWAIFLSAFYLIVSADSLWGRIFFALLIVLSLARYSPNMNFPYHHNVPIYPLAALGFGRMCGYLFARRLCAPRSLPALLTLALAAYFSFSILDRSVQAYRKLTSGAELIYGEDVLAQEINRLLEPQQKYWAAPLFLRMQYYAKAQFVGPYRFYLPWLAHAARIETRLLLDLRASRPELIVFDAQQSIWGRPLKQYGRHVHALIKKAYVRHPKQKRFFILRGSELQRRMATPR